MNRLTRDGTAEPVSRDQILRHARGQGNVHFPCSADHEQDWQPYPVDPYSAILYVMTIHTGTYIHTYTASPVFLRALLTWWAELEVTDREHCPVNCIINYKSPPPWIEAEKLGGAGGMEGGGGKAKEEEDRDNYTLYIYIIEKKSSEKQNKKNE